MGVLCSTVRVSYSTVVYEDSYDVSGNMVGVAGSTVGRDAVLYYDVSGNTSGV